MRTIDYMKLKDNVDLMINTLEWDSMRSGGKTKNNATELVALYQLQDRWTQVPKITPKKKEVT